MAGKPTGPYVQDGWLQRQQPVEQQTPGGATQPDRGLWVTNPTPCAWDADDSKGGAITGLFLPGQSASWDACVMADWTAHLVVVRNRDPRLSVTLTVPGLLTVPVVDTVCIVGPEYDASAQLPPVEGSNGGIAQRYEYLVTATNTTERRLREQSVTVQLSVNASGYYPPACPLPVAGQRQGSYPGPWWWVE
jgi:hypothetical protein